MSTDLYQEGLLALADAAHGEGRLDAPDVTLTLDNPLCGDRVTLDLHCDQAGRIAALGHHVRGCVLCRAATNLLGQQAVGQDTASLDTLHRAIKDALRGRHTWPTDEPWQDLVLFEPAAAHKSRHECVLLPFAAVVEALRQHGDGAATGT